MLLLVFIFELIYVVVSVRVNFWGLGGRCSVQFVSCFKCIIVVRFSCLWFVSVFLDLTFLLGWWSTWGGSGKGVPRQRRGKLHK